jgi:hypothetical protein
MRTQGHRDALGGGDSDSGGLGGGIQARLDSYRFCQEVKKMQEVPSLQQELSKLQLCGSRARKPIAMAW